MATNAWARNGPRNQTLNASHANVNSNASTTSHNNPPFNTKEVKVLLEQGPPDTELLEFNRNRV